MVGEVTWWSCLWIPNCYHQSLLCGACFGLLDCHITLITLGCLSLGSL